MEDLSPRVCVGCSTEFVPRTSRNIWCTVRCRREKLGLGGGLRPCRTCGKEFKPVAAQRYCSPECKPAKRAKKPHQRAVNAWRTCVDCGKRWKPSDRGVATQKCIECRKADAEIHVYTRTKDWKRAIRQRAKGLCEECGKNEGELGAPHHAHHILPRAQGGQNTLVNGKLLCVLCHDKAHGGNALGGAVFGTNPSGDVLDRLADKLADRVADRVIDALRPYINL